MEQPYFEVGVGDRVTVRRTMEAHGIKLDSNNQITFGGTGEQSMRFEADVVDIRGNLVITDNPPASVHKKWIVGVSKTNQPT